MQKNLTPSHIAANILLTSLLSLDISLQLSDSAISTLVSETSIFISEQPNIAIIGAAAFLQASKILSSSNFKIYFLSTDIQTNPASFAEAPNLSNVPSEYYESANIFSKIKAKVLVSHCPYNL